MYSTVRIFKFSREQFQHLLENNRLLYSLHCSLLTPTYERVLISSYPDLLPDVVGRNR